MSFTNTPVLFKLQEKIEVTQKRDVEGMGIPEIKYGESMCFVQHVSTGLWLTYAAVDAKSARLGPLKRKVWQSRWTKLKPLMGLNTQRTVRGYDCWGCACFLRPYSIKKVTWMMHSQSPDLKLKSPKLRE